VNCRFATPVICVLSILAQSCLHGFGPRCEETTVAESSSVRAVATLTYRTCGSADGFIVQVLPLGKHEIASGSNDSVPCMVRCDCPFSTKADVPITLQWKSADQLLVRYQPWSEKYQSRLIVVKAERLTRGVAVEYDPPPVVWRSKDIKKKPASNQ
jgi:hypothetical protein